MQSTLPIPSAPLLRIYTLGSFRIEHLIPSESLSLSYHPIADEEWGGRVGAGVSLLKVLLCTNHRRAAKAWLAETLWPESEERPARNNLNVAIRIVRGVLGTVQGTSLLRETLNGEGLSLAEQSFVWVDMEAFEQVVAQAMHADRLQRADQARACWEHAYQLGSAGSFLPDDLYQEWTQAPRHRYELLFPRCVRRVAELVFAEGKPDEAETILRPYWSTHLADEEALRLLMRVLSMQGLYQEALHSYEMSTHALDEELEVEPGAATKAMAEAIRQEQRSHISPLSTWKSPLAATFTPLLDDKSVSDPFVYGTFLGTPFLEFQQALHQRITAVDMPFQQNEVYSISRRQALLTIASLTIPLVAACQKDLSHLDTEEFLSSCATSVTACWHLSNEFDITAVYSVVSQYLPALIAIIKQFPTYRTIAANIVAQAFLLKAIVGRHVASLSMAEADCQKAIEYSAMAENSLLHVASLRHLAMIYYYAKQHRKEAAVYERIQPLLSLEAVSPLMRSFVYAGWAELQALQGQAEDGLKSLALARETFAMQSATEACPAYIDYDYSQLFISEGLTYYDLGLYQKALDAFLLVDGLAPKVPVAERGRLEFLNSQALTTLRLPHRDRDMQQCITYWTAGIQGAIHLRSKQRYDEACHIYELMEFVWPYEKQIKALREMMVQWDEGK